MSSVDPFDTSSTYTASGSIKIDEKSALEQIKELVKILEAGNYTSSSSFLFPFKDGQTESTDTINKLGDQLSFFVRDVIFGSLKKGRTVKIESVSLCKATRKALGLDLKRKSSFSVNLDEGLFIFPLKKTKGLVDEVTYTVINSKKKNRIHGYRIYVV